MYSMIRSKYRDVLGVSYVRVGIYTRMIVEDYLLIYSSCKY